MTTESGPSSPEPQEHVIQDGVACPRQAPWRPWVSLVTTLSFLPMLFLGTLVLALTSWLVLVLWLLVLALFAYPLRYLVCARCPYYGQRCSTLMGTAVPRMFSKQEGSSMVLGLWLDVVAFAMLFLMPLHAVWTLGGIVLLILWIGAFALILGTITRLACTVCPLTFCPIGRAGRALWGSR